MSPFYHSTSPCLHLSFNIPLPPHSHQLRVSFQHTLVLAFVHHPQIYRHCCLLIFVFIFIFLLLLFSCLPFSFSRGLHLVAPLIICASAPLVGCLSLSSGRFGLPKAPYIVLKEACKSRGERGPCSRARKADLDLARNLFAEARDRNAPSSQRVRRGSNNRSADGAQ